VNTIQLLPVPDIEKFYFKNFYRFLSDDHSGDLVWSVVTIES